MKVNPLVREVEELGADESLDWTCAECDETFTTEKSFNLHQKVDHDKSRPFI